MFSYEEILKFKTDYQLRFGENIDNLFDDPSKATAQIQEANDVIERFLLNNCPKYSYWKETKRLDKFKIEAIWNAKLIQCNWVENVKDFSTTAGYDPVTNQYVNMRDLKKRYIAPKAIDELKSHGLLYAGLGCFIPNDIVPWI